MLDREVLEQEAPSAAVTSALRALADISATAAKLAGLGFDMIGPPGLGVGWEPIWKDRKRGRSEGRPFLLQNRMEKRHLRSMGNLRLAAY